LKQLAFLLSFFVTTIAFSQIKAPDLSKVSSSKEKINLWRNYCNELMGSSDESQYKLLIKEARKGLELVPEDSIKGKAMFHLFAGVANEYTYQYGNSIQEFKTCIELSRKVNAISYEITALSRLEIIYDKINDVAGRKEVMNRMVEISRKTSDLSVKELTESALSGYYRDINNYEKAIEYKIKANETYKLQIKTDTLISEQNAATNLGINLSNLGNLFNEVGQFEKALQYLNEAKVIIGDKAFEGNEESLYVFMIQSFLGLDQIDSAKYYYDTSYKKMADRDTAYGALTYINQFLGQYYLEKSKIDSANIFAQNAFRLSKKSSDNISITLTSELLGNIYYQQKKYKEALQLLKIALNNDFEFNKNQLASLHKMVADCYEKTNQLDSAYVHFKAYSLINDTIMKAIANKNFAEAEARYQNKEKRLQIAENNLKLADAQKQKFRLIFGLIVASILLILLIVIYRNRNKTANLLKENNTQLEYLNQELDVANQTKATLFGIISHDLRAPVSQLHNFIKIQQINSKALTEEQKLDLNEKIQKNTEHLLESMEDLLMWSKTQMNELVVKNETINFLEIVQNSIQLLEMNSDAQEIKYHLQIDARCNTQTDKNFLTTIIRNILQNAIKASPQKGSIHILLTEKMDQYILTIQNDGKIFTQEDFEKSLQDQETLKLSGLGLRIIKILADKIEMKIQFSSPLKTGTQVDLILPKNNV
jgi:signal transduction histidine kinase